MPKKPKYKPLTGSSLEIEQTVDRKHSGEYYKRFGAKYGLGVIDFIRRMFEINETELPRLKKMTDAEIARQISVEYKAYPSTVRWYTKTRNAVVEARQRYNRGQMTNGYPPEHLSYRYSARGDKIHRNKKMTEEADIKYRVRWTAFHVFAAERDKSELIKRSWMIFDRPDLFKPEYEKIKRMSALSKEAWKNRPEKLKKELDEDDMEF